MHENTLMKYTMTYGLYLGLAFSGVVIILKLTGAIHHPGDIAGMVNAMLLSMGMIVFGKKYRLTLHEEQFTYKNALGFTVMLTLFSAIIYTFFSYWYFGVIEPASITNYIDMMRIAYAQNGSFSDEQVNALVELYNTALTPGIMAFIVFLSQMLIGVLMGLLAAVFIKTPNSINQNNY